MNLSIQICWCRKLFCTHLCSGTGRVLGEAFGWPWAREVQENGWEEVAVLEGGRGGAKVLRAPCAPRPQSFKKACGNPHTY